LGFKFGDKIVVKVCVTALFEVFKVPFAQEAVAKIPKTVGKVGLLGNDISVSLYDVASGIARHHLHVPCHAGGRLGVYLDVGVELEKVIALRSAVLVLRVRSDLNLPLRQSKAPR
jgi:hypothetical protein